MKASRGSPAPTVSCLYTTLAGQVLNPGSLSL